MPAHLVALPREAALEQEEQCVCERLEVVAAARRTPQVSMHARVTHGSSEVLGAVRTSGQVGQGQARAGEGRSSQALAHFVGNIHPRQPALEFRIKASQNISPIFDK